MTNVLQASYELAATMRRSMTMMQAEMHEHRIAASFPQDKAAALRAREAAKAYLDAFFDAEWAAATAAIAQDK